MSTSTPTVVNLRSITFSVYVPAILIGVGQGAIAPVIALSARDLGASVGVAGFIVALTGLGQLVGDIPAGAFASRIGERRAMICASALLCGALAMCVYATQVWMLGVAIAILGAAGAVWGIARHSFLTEAVPYRMRARAMSTLGGTHRIGMFVGPFVGAAAMARGGTDNAFWVYIAAAVAAGVLVAALRDPSSAIPAAERGNSGADQPTGGTLQVLREHLPVFRTLGLGVFAVGAVRAARQAVIPLWGEHIGLDPTTISLIFGIAGAVDMIMFYPAGKAMDRFGRVWVAVPCMTVMALAYCLVPLSHDATTLLATALLLGFGNGLGSGIVLTLGSDASPVDGRAKFLGGWRLCADSGNACGPLLISGVTLAAALGPAIWATALLGFAGAAALWRWIPRRADAVRSPVSSRRAGE